MIAGGLSRLPRGWLGWGAGALAAALGALALATPAEPARGLARAALVVAGLGAAAAWARRGASAQAASPVRVIARAALARDTGVALVELDGRRLVVGFGPGGVQLLAPADGDAPARGRP